MPNPQLRVRPNRIRRHHYPQDYTFPCSYDIDLFYRVRNDWLRRLYQLRCSPAALGNDDIAAFTEFLVENQRGHQGPNRIGGSWCIPADPAMPSDARVDFSYMPSYIAVAWLCLVWQEYPAIAIEFEGFRRVLKRGLDFCAGRKLAGHGYDSEREMLIAIEYLALGKVFTFVRERPGFSPAFEQAIASAKAAIRHRLANNGDWSGIEPPRARRALTALAGRDRIDSKVCARVPESLWEEETTNKPERL